jgi:hypothetical protein
MAVVLRNVMTVSRRSFFSFVAGLFAAAAVKPVCSAPHRMVLVRWCGLPSPFFLDGEVPNTYTALLNSFDNSSNPWMDRRFGGCPSSVLDDADNPDNWTDACDDPSREDDYEEPEEPDA